MEGRFEDEAIGDAGVEARGEGSVGVELSLTEELKVQSVWGNSFVVPGLMAYVVCAVEGKEGVWRQLLATGREGMADLEQRIYRKALVQLCAQARKGLVLEKHAALHLLGNLVNRPRIRQPKRCSSDMEGLVDVDELVEDAVGARCREVGGDRWHGQGRVVQAGRLF